MDTFVAVGIIAALITIFFYERERYIIQQDTYYTLVSIVGELSAIRNTLTEDDEDDDDEYYDEEFKP